MRAGLVTALAAPLLGRLAWGYEVQTPPLDTDWTYEVGTDPWPEYPRPQLQRDSWQSLNGIWKWAPGSGNQYGTGYPVQPAAPPTFGTANQDVLIPSCVESGLSGIQQLNITDHLFETSFELPKKWSNSSELVLLNFEAVDYQTTVYVNGAKAGEHTGGYWRFTIDVTTLVKQGSNQL